MQLTIVSAASAGYKKGANFKNSLKIAAENGGQMPRFSDAPSLSKEDFRTLIEAILSPGKPEDSKRWMYFSNESSPLTTSQIREIADKVNGRIREELPDVDPKTLAFGGGIRGSLFGYYFLNMHLDVHSFFKGTARAPAVAVMKPTPAAEALQTTTLLRERQAAELRGASTVS
jgi:hypothetical protein